LVERKVFEDFKAFLGGVLGSDHAQHNARAAEFEHQSAHVDAFNADDLVVDEVGIAIVLRGVVGGDFHHLAHNETGDFGAVRFDVAGRDTVAADDGVGEGNKLTRIGRVSQDFLIARHRGIEHDFTS
jgi:hypothetical protein